MRNMQCKLTFRRCLAVCALVALAGVAAFNQARAQLPTATVLGVVRDSSGAVVPGVSISARHVETGQTRTTVSGNDGSYRLAALPVGAYEIRAEQQGFKTEVRSGIKLNVSDEATIHFTMEVGAIQETVSVTGEAPLVNTTSGTLGGLVDEQKVSELPLNGRNYVDLTLLQTGVSQHVNRSPTTTLLVGMLFSSNGATLRSNNFLLDGAIMQGYTGVAAASTSGSTLGIEGIREYKLLTGAFSAEYGLTMGSQMLIVSKSGTNAWHGSAFEFFRNSALDARNFFDRKTDLELATGTGRRLPAFGRNNFGGSFGGPIKRDKTFFYAVFEAIRDHTGVTTNTSTLPAGCRGDASNIVTTASCSALPAGTAPVTIDPVVRPLLALYPLPNLPNNQFTFPFNQPTKEHYGQIRVDHSVGSSDQIFVRYTVDDTRQTTPLKYQQFLVERESRFQYLTLSDNHIFSPTLLNTVRFSFSRTNTFVKSPTDLIGSQYSFVPGEPIGALSIAGTDGLGPNGLSPNDKLQNIYTLSDDLFYTMGRHSLKFGTLMNRWESFTLNGTNRRGSVAFPSILAFLQATPSNIQAATSGSIFDRLYRYYSYGFYVQDDLRLRPNLMLNIGLRYEFLTTLTETHGHGAVVRDLLNDANTTLGEPFLNPSLKNFSPRFGFAWDVKGDGKLAVRGGGGLLYDLSNMAGGLSAGSSATPPFSTLSSLANPGRLVLPLTFPASAAGRALRGVDYHVQQPHIIQYNLTIEKQLPAQMAATVSYAGSRGFNIPIIVDGNPTIPQGIPTNGLCVASPTPVPYNPDRSVPRCWLDPATRNPRTNPAWTGVELYTAGSNSWYNSFQFGLNKRLSKGLQFQSSYTFSKLIDESSSQVNSDNNATADWTSDPMHRETDRSLASFDITNNWRLNTIYKLPQFSSAGGVKGSLLNGWWISNILSVQTGYPMTVSINSNRSRSNTGNGAAGIDRPDTIPGRSFEDITQGTSVGCASTGRPGNVIAAGTPLGTPDLYYDPCAFSLPALGFLGTAGRNILRGPGVANLDFSLAKDTAVPALGESGKLEFRAEFFNVLNRAAFGTPNRTNFAGSSTNPAAGAESPLNTAALITNAATSRQIQFGLKLLF